MEMEISNGLSAMAAQRSAVSTSTHTGLLQEQYSTQARILGLTLARILMMQLGSGPAYPVLRMKETLLAKYSRQAEILLETSFSSGQEIA
jgi:hypothetical protein